MPMKAQIVRPEFPPAHWVPPPMADEATMPAAPLAKLNAVARLVTIGPDEELFAQGAPVRHGYQIVSGCLRAVRLMEDGRRLIDRFLLPGDLLGFDAGTHHDMSAEAIGPTTVRRIPIQAIIDTAADDAGFARFLWRAVAAELRGAHDHGLLLGRKTAVERVASFLHEMAQRMPCDIRADRVVLPMGRADIADHLGLTVETVSRTLTQLRQGGLITVQHGAIGIRNAIALSDLACDSGHAPTMGEQRAMVRH